MFDTLFVVLLLIGGVLLAFAAPRVLVLPPGRRRQAVPQVALGAACLVAALVLHTMG